jgi:hypothetical protein
MFDAKIYKLDRLGSGNNSRMESTSLEMTNEIDYTID